MLFMSDVYINKIVFIKIELKIESQAKRNRDFDLEAILAKFAISMSMLEIVTPLSLINILHLLQVTE